MCRSVGLVVDRQLVCGVVVGQIVAAFAPVALELLLGFAWHWSHHKQMSMQLLFCGTMVWLVMPTAVELSIWIGVRSWG